MKKHAKPIHGSQEWLELRHRIDGRCVIGASEVPALLNQSPYKTRHDLYISKMTDVEVSDPTAAMRRGTLLEPSLIEYAKEELGQEIVVPDVMFQSGRIIATLDGQVNASWGVEAKTTNAWAEGQDLPIEFVLQAQAQMLAAEMERVTFSILDRNLRLSLIDVVRDEVLIDTIADEAERFAEIIDGEGVFEEGDFTLPQIATLYPDPSGEVELSPSTIDLLIEWGAVKDQIKQIESREKEIKDALANLLLDAEYGVVAGNRVVSFKRQQQTRVDTARLKALVDPSIVEQATSVSSFRVMRSMI